MIIGYFISVTILVYAGVPFIYAVILPVIGAIFFTLVVPSVILIVGTTFRLLYLKSKMILTGEKK